MIIKSYIGAHAIMLFGHVILRNDDLFFQMMLDDLVYNSPEYSVYDSDVFQ